MKKNNLGKFGIATLIFLSSASSFADSTADLQTLNDAKALLDAQAAKDISEAAAIKAAADLAKAKAGNSTLSDDIQKTQNDSSAALAKSKVDNTTAQIAEMKTIFGEPPKVGSDGTVTITDATSGTLLQTKSGSLKATAELAEALCKNLQSAQLQNLYIAPPDLDVKIQSSRMILREYNALKEKISNDDNLKLVGLGGVKSQVTPAAVLGAVTLIQYGAGALQTLAKLAKSDYAIALSDGRRETWLEFFVAAKCPAQLPLAQIEATVRGQSQNEILTTLDKMSDFADAAANQKTATSDTLAQLNATLAKQKKQKQDTSIIQKSIDEKNNQLNALKALDVWLPRLKALTDLISAHPETFLEALTWNAFDPSGNPLVLNDGLLNLGTGNRLSLVLTTQDGQITKTHWLTGQKVYGRSSGELIYRVLSSKGNVLTAGYLTAKASTGKIEFDESGTVVVDNVTFSARSQAALVSESH